MEMHIPGVDFTVEVEFDYAPGTPGCNYLPNGDPGYPDEPPEVDLTGVWLDEHDIRPLLSKRVIDYIEDRVLSIKAQGGDRDD